MKPGYYDNRKETGAIWSLVTDSSSQTSKDLSMRILRNMSLFENVNFTLSAQGKENIHQLD